MRALRTAFLVGGGVVLAPLLAFGHGVEFLLAKLTLGEAGVRVELTADCGDNLMLPDRDTARAAMERLFHVVLDGEGGAAGEPWTRLAALRYENRSTLDPSVPLPPDPSWQDRPHDLLTGIWQWQPPAGSRFQLAVPRGEPVDTLLWQADTPDGNPKWKILISGDRTEWFGPLVEDAWWRSPWLLALLALGVLCFLFWAHRRKL